jgi:hypothetical protein
VAVLDMRQEAAAGRREESGFRGEEGDGTGGLYLAQA